MMSKLQEKMSEKMFALFGGIVKSLSDIEYAIQNDAEYMKKGNSINQAKNDMSHNRPENLDYSDVERDRLEEYFMYAADKDVAYFADTIKIMKEIKMAISEYKNALLKDDFEKVTEAYQKVYNSILKDSEKKILKTSNPLAPTALKIPISRFF